MSGETALTIHGNLTSDPELRFTPSGVAVASFTVASTPRKYNVATKQWEDGDALFLRCSIWRQAAENLANSLGRGARVMVTGTLRQRSYETKDGENVTVLEVDGEEAGASLKYATVKVNKVTRSTNSDRSGTGTSNTGGGEDLWGSRTPAADAEPPF